MRHDLFLAISLCWMRYHERTFALRVTIYTPDINTKLLETAEMIHDEETHTWSRKDRALHLLPASPLIAFYIGTITLLAMHSLTLVLGFLAFWFVTNLFIAGVCAGCPYRGRYCPGLAQLYIGPYLSLLMYRGSRQGLKQRTLLLNIALLSVFGIGSYVFAFVWLFALYWPKYAALILSLLALLLLHMPLSFFLLCPNCGYNEICPMAKVHTIFRRTT
jgi:hypothetical protein